MKEKCISCVFKNKDDNDDNFICKQCNELTEDEPFCDENCTDCLGADNCEFYEN